MTDSRVTRRQFATRLATAGGLTLISRRARAADFPMRHYHNQPPESPLHKRLVEMWAVIRTETAGRVEVEVFPGSISSSGAPAAPNSTQMLRDGEIEFSTVSASGLASFAPVVQVQATPYAFRTQAQVFEAMDGALGDYLREELRALGLYAVPRGCFDNGFHQITTATRPLRTPADMVGLRLRSPGSPLYLELFETLGAVTHSMNITTLHAALESDLVEAQADPISIVEFFKLYEVQTYVNMTNHAWSGFSLIANLRAWQRLPADVQGIIERNTRIFAARQRADNAVLNGPQGRARLIGRGMVFSDLDTAPFRAPLSAFYARWKQAIGQKAMNLLEAQVGRLA
ncbi:MAG: TRAP transporter substrate-binding protein [Acidobacteria bacterium]|nr:TRAP transporter substrate-binding protein [Acidobacteriota bacterium]